MAREHSGGQTAGCNLAANARSSPSASGRDAYNGREISSACSKLLLSRTLGLSAPVNGGVGNPTHTPERGCLTAQLELELETARPQMTVDRHRPAQVMPALHVLWP